MRPGRINNKRPFYQSVSTLFVILFLLFVEQSASWRNEYIPGGNLFTAMPRQSLKTVRIKPSSKC